MGGMGKLKIKIKNKINVWRVTELIDVMEKKLSILSDMCFLQRLI